MGDGVRITTKVLRWIWVIAAGITLLFGVATPDWDALAELIADPSVDADKASVMLAVAWRTLPATLATAGLVALWLNYHPADGVPWLVLAAVSVAILVAGSFLGELISPDAALDRSGGPGWWDVGGSATEYLLHWSSIVLNSWLFTYGPSVTFASVSIGAALGCTICWGIDHAHENPGPSV